MQQGIGMTQVFPQKVYRLEKEEKSKWEFQHSGINAKKEKLSIGKEVYQFTLCIFRE